MSRSNYSDDCDNWQLIKWRGAVNSAIKGKRGQAFLKELLAALDALPKKELIADELQTGRFEVCALGAVGLQRGLEMQGLDVEDYDVLSEKFGIAPALIREIEYINDEYTWGVPIQERNAK